MLICSKMLKVNINLRRVKGGVIYYSLLVVILTTTVTTGFILLSQLWFKEDSIAEKSIVIEDNIFSAIEIIKENPDLLTIGEDKVLILSNRDTVIVNCKRWGVLKLISFHSRWHAIERDKLLLMGDYNRDRYALTIPDNNYPVSLVGNSFIKGDCKLPAKGIRAGDAGGFRFTGDFIIEGNIENSDTIIEPISDKITIDIKESLTFSKFMNDSIIDIYDSSQLNVDNSFKEKTVIYRADSNITLSDDTIKGNSIVWSSDTIFIENNSFIENAILYADAIVVRSNFEGATQLYAKDGVDIEDNVLLKHPSFIGLLAEQEESKIVIGDSSSIYGGVFATNRDSVDIYTHIDVKSDATIFGNVYGSNQITLTGAVKGELIGENLIYRSGWSFYESFIVNGSVDETAIPTNFATFDIGNNPDRLEEVYICH